MPPPQITIYDTQTPMVVLLGTPQSGTTMIFVRLIRYLLFQGFRINPIRKFRNAADMDYQKVCNGFNKLVYEEDVAEATWLINNTLVAVEKDGKRLCQILKVPGTDFFDPHFTAAVPPGVLVPILMTTNRKIFCITIDMDQTDAKTCVRYAQWIGRFKSELYSRDRVVFMLNKIDQTCFVHSRDRINLKAAFREVLDSYPGIFEPFRNTGPLLRLFKPYSFDIVPFMTGRFPILNGRKKFFPGSDVFPARLWQTILRHLRL